MLRFVGRIARFSLGQRNHMLSLTSITKTQLHGGKRVDVIHDFSLTIAEGKFVAIVGPSGCGKSTLLRIIAGLDQEYTGTVVVGGESVTGPDVSRGMVFQENTLFPWLTVYENIAFGLRLQNMDDAVIAERVATYLERTHLTAFASYYPNALSGGMQQRVALARALVTEPRVLLMDEPFGALDSQTRSQMQEFLAELCDDLRMTIVFVTHDVGEAVFLADEVLVLSPQPAKIAARFDVPFARPRRHALKQSDVFFALERSVTLALDNA